MRRAHAALARRDVPLASNQVKYSLLDRRIRLTFYGANNTQGP
jgi:hypothetical protein